MKRYYLLILFIGAWTLSAWAQLSQINGTTRTRTKVTYGAEAKTAHIPPGFAVDILDANKYFFTIRYKEGNGYVNRTHIDCDSTALNSLMKFKNGMGNGWEFQKMGSKVDDKYKYEIDHLRYCAGKYQREIMTGYGLSLAGLAAVASPSFVDFNNPDREKVVKQVGYGLGVLGALLIIDSNKWMKRMYFGPDGFGIKYSF